MKILLVAATIDEIKPIVHGFGISVADPQVNAAFYNKHTTPEHPNFEILITGVGMVATAFALGRHLSLNAYDLVLNLGIAGSFDKNVSLGEVFEIAEDTIAELGAEDGERFLSIADLGFGDATFYPTAKIADLYNLFNTFNLKPARAVTVNTVHGNEASITKVIEHFNPQMESMEGAAFFYACRQMDVPGVQVRAVSNYVERRNRDNWQIGAAIKNLNTFAINFLKLYA